MTAADLSDLRKALIEGWSADVPHEQKIAFCSAVICEAFARCGLRATLVGGGAVEFHAPGAHTTYDIDLIVEIMSRERIDQVLSALGMERRGRHWIRDDLFVEVPGSWLEGRPVEEHEVGSYTLRVIAREAILAERLAAYRWGRSLSDGFQAAGMIAAFGDELDSDALRVELRREQAEETYEKILSLVRSGEPIDSAALDALWQRSFRYKGGA